MHLEVSSVKEFAVSLRKSADEIEEKAKLVHGKVSMDIERGMKLRAPFRYGALRNSIGTEIEEVDDTLRAIIGPTMSYAIFLELGTSRMKPRPYMRPAIDVWEKPYFKAMEQVIKNATS